MNHRQTIAVIVGALLLGGLVTGIAHAVEAATSPASAPSTLSVQ